MRERMKRILSLLLALVMVLGMAPAMAAEEEPGKPVSAVAEQFSDLPEDWSRPALEAAVENGLLQGSDGKIDPKGPLTRSQLATILTRAFGAKTEADLSGFGDVASGAWYAQAMRKAVAMGLFQGAEGKLEPDRSITRQEVFTVLARALKLEDGNGDVLSQFSDGAQVAPWAKGAVSAVVSKGYVSGADGKLSPAAHISRAEFAQIMYNAVQQYIREPGTYTQVAEGTVVITVPGVTLENVVISGDLIVGDGVGDGAVTLNHVTVKGSTIVRDAASQVGGDGEAADGILISGLRDLTITEGNKRQIHVTTTPEQATLSASSEDERVATATLDGSKLTLAAKRRGSTVVTVTATAQGYPETSKSFKLTVREMDDFQGQVEEDGFVLYKNGNIADLYVETDDHKQVVRAVGDLRTDMKAVTGKTPVIKNETAGLGDYVVIVGSIDQSQTIQKLMADEKLDEAKDIQGDWESYVIKLVEDPMEGVDQALVIAGSDSRGTIYGIYELSQRIGVSPWYWWADVAPEQQSKIIVTEETIVQGEPSVKYRGIFLNDEENFTEWSKQFENTTNSPGHPNSVTYAKVFELMLRLKANTVWPGMHKPSDAFNKYEDEDGLPINAKVADEYGVLMGSSHCENMFRNNEGEWYQWADAHKDQYDAKGAPKYDYSINPRAIEAYWKERLVKSKEGGFENIYTLGMRGVHDSGMEYSQLPDKTLKGQIGQMQKIIDAQRAMIKEVFGSEDAVPQVFIPYKEAASYYNGDPSTGVAGVEIPEDVTLMWTDDNQGLLRQVPTAEERERSGGAGVYYHVSYWGQPISYLWLSTTPLSMIYEELKKAYDTGAKDYWIINVGDLKPSEIALEFCMELAWDVERYDSVTITDFLSDLAMRDFEMDRDQADEVADIMRSYYQYNIAMRPEFQGFDGKKAEGMNVTMDLYSPTANGDESQIRIDQMTALYDRSSALYDALPEEQKAAFYEMVYYPIRASKFQLEKNLYAERGRLYKEQGRYGSVNAYIELSKAAYRNIMADLSYYNKQLQGGKWREIMNPYQRVNGLPQIIGELDYSYVTQADAVEGIGSVCEGQKTGTEATTLAFASLTDDKRFIDVFSREAKANSWTAEVSGDFIQLSKTQGSVETEDRLWVSIDWSKAQNGVNAGSVTISGAHGFRKTYPVSAVKTELALEDNAYAEGSGYVAIEAEHYTEAVAKGNDQWKLVRNLGRNGGSMKVYPEVSNKIKADFETEAAQLKYRVYFETAGTFTGTLYRIPTLNEGSENGETKTAQLAVGLEGVVPTVLSGEASGLNRGNRWRKNTQEQIEKLTFQIVVEEPGYHTLVVYKADSGIAFDRIVINTGGENTSYMGPHISYNTIQDTYAAAPTATPPQLSLDGLVFEEGRKKDTYWFNFGGTKDVRNYTTVRATTIYDGSQSYGWTAESAEKVSAVYRDITDANAKTVERDKSFLHGTEEAHFITKLPAGTYNVQLAMGDKLTTGDSMTFDMNVKANGVDVLTGGASTPGKTTEYTFKAAVAANQVLDLAFSGTWGVMSLEITPYTPAQVSGNSGAFVAEGGEVWIEAEVALEESEFAKTTAPSTTRWMASSGLSGGGVIHGPSSNTNHNTTGNLKNSPTLAFKVNFPQGGDYTVWALKKAIADSHDSYHMGLDGAYKITYNPTSPQTEAYEWAVVSGVLTVGAGTHTVNIWGREDGILLDKFLITKNGTVPSGLGGVMKRANSDEVAATQVTLQATENVITVGNSTALTAQVVPSNVTTGGVTWSILSGNSSAVLEEQDDGSAVLTGTKAGTVVVKAASKQTPGVYARYTITVNGKKGIAYGTFLEEDGRVCIDTATALENSAYASYENNDTHKWAMNSEKNGLQLSPDSGNMWGSSNVTELEGIAPKLSFTVDFVTPGTYYLYTLSSYPNDAGDSIHVALDGDYQFNTNNSRAGKLQWEKYPSYWNFTVGEAGTHEITVWAREDGLVSNKLYLTQDPAEALPRGMGPRESAREEIETTIPVKLVTIQGTVPSIEVGEETVLSGTVTPAEANDTSATWSVVSGTDCVELTNLDNGQVKVVGKAAGEAVIRLTSVQNPEVYGEYTVTVVGEGWVPGAFLEADGRVCIGAQAATEGSVYASSSGSDIHTWEAKEVNGAEALVLTPNKNNGNLGSESNLTNLPKLTFQIHFQNTGTYYLYTFSSHPDDSSDSYFVGLDGVFKFDTNNNTGHRGDLKWDRNTSIWKLDITEPGIHTITLWAREDGVTAHKFYLTQDGTEELPTGSGPAVSGRVKLPPVAPDLERIEPIPEELVPQEPLPEDGETADRNEPETPENGDALAPENEDADAPEASEPESETAPT